MSVASHERGIVEDSNMKFVAFAKVRLDVVRKLATDTAQVGAKNRIV